MLERSRKKKTNLWGDEKRNMKGVERSEWVLGGKNAQGSTL